jgi:NDP-sugar pyrophosphorylase family protein
MGTTFIETSQGYGWGFTGRPEEYQIRNRQLEWLYAGMHGSMYHFKEQAASGPPRASCYRKLTGQEIQSLKQNRNACADWEEVRVTARFNPDLIQDNFFAGFVRIGDMDGGLLKYHDYTLPVGITRSRIISCDIGDRCAVHDCRYASHYIIGDKAIISSVNELDTTDHAKFGCGIVKDGEDEALRIWIDPINEAGGRSVLPFTDLIPADASLWAVNRLDQPLLEAFKHMTQQSADSRRGYYGIIGHGAVIKHCLTIKDVFIGSGAYIKGANKLKNLTVKSHPQEPTQIGEGVELVNGIIGQGCRVFYGSKAVRFVLGDNCSLKYGARLIHSILGDNSTVSCCEVLNNLVFPGHEQHHNNSFLIAALIMGQSNMAAGATVGSNHNSRGNDGEIIAGRGFWPGLSSALKHNSRFASYTLIAKGSYPSELHIPLPFSLVTNNAKGTRREVMPAYWWRYNMYALERNSRKYRERDARRFPEQYIEAAYLAPDTASEMIGALGLLGKWLDQAAANSRGDPSLPCRPSGQTGGLLLPARALERSRRQVNIIAPEQGMAAYRQMLLHYAVTALAGFLAEKALDFPAFQAAHPRALPLEWENLGGQLVPSAKADRLRQEIREGVRRSWEAVHEQYRRFQGEYSLDKGCNGLQVLRFLHSGDAGSAAPLSLEDWEEALVQDREIQRYIAEQVIETKRKDYLDPFRRLTYRNEQEQAMVLGPPPKGQPEAVSTAGRVSGAGFP